jgi:hypothetical protein
MSDHEHTEPEPDERAEGVEDLDAPEGDEVGSEPPIERDREADPD